MATRCGLLSRHRPPSVAEVRWAHRPVEGQLPDNNAWLLGRISGWWAAAAGEVWCRLRTLSGGDGPRRCPYDPESVRLLPGAGI
ncbi:hypothetical protein [Streptomyces sp. NPDC001657]|uniref:hypothetical protein n=1 Tax=unclassified Streptomyces TaxID=2593676 RepID=UPI003319AED8